MRLHAPTLVAAVATIALAACGGGTSPTPAGSAATASTAPASSVAPPASDAVSSPGPSAAAACDRAPVDAVATVSVTIMGFAYSPEPVSAAAGDVITWKNDDPAPHTATLEDDSCGTAPIAPGASGSLVFSAAGTYTYKCIIHPTQMKGFTIEVK